MTRHAPALLALSVVAVAGWTYNVNYDTRAALDRLAALRAQIAEEREALQVLRVEWAYLNAPDRLATLVAAHNGTLGLVPLVPEALGIAAAVPYPPRQAPGVPPTPPAPSEAPVAAAPSVPAPADPAAADPGAATVATLSPPAATAAPPAPAPADAAQPAETVPAALEASIAAALVEAGVPAADRPGPPRDGVIAVPADPTVGAFAASGAPVPAARPAAWSRR